VRRYSRIDGKMAELFAAALEREAGKKSEA
jgi:hypothetical protein